MIELPVATVDLKSIKIGIDDSQLDVSHPAEGGEFAEDFSEALNASQELASMLKSDITDISDSADSADSAVIQSVPNSDVSLKVSIEVTEAINTEIEESIAMIPVVNLVVPDIETKISDTEDLAETKPINKLLLNDSSRVKQAQIDPKTATDSDEKSKQQDEPALKKQAVTNKLEIDTFQQEFKSKHVAMDVKQLAEAFVRKDTFSQDNKTTITNDVKSTNTQTPLAQYQQVSTDLNNAVQQSHKITEPFNHPRWQQSFSERVVFLGQQQIKGASIQLNPPELGPLNINIKFDQQQISIMFTSAHGAVRDVIEEALPRLREMFEDNGLSLGDVNISDRSTQGGQERESFFAEGDELGVFGENNHQTDEEKMVTTTKTVINSLVDRYV